MERFWVETLKWLSWFVGSSIKMYKLDPAYFLSVPRLAWKQLLEETEIELELQTNIDMIQMAEKGIGGGMSHNLSMVKGK